METVGSVKKKKNRRYRKRKKKIINKNIRCVGVNAAGLSSKLQSMDFILHSLQPQIFSIQETKIYKPGKIKTNNTNKYSIYELHRKNSKGGGLCLGVLNELSPVWVAEGDDDSEYLTVEVNLEQIKLRIISFYGPQECAHVEKKIKFWTDIEHQVTAAVESQCAVLLQGDSNCWAGPDLIPGDVNTQNQNGKLLEKFLNKFPNLSLINGTNQCKGSITRQRITKQKKEESILDLFIVCEKLKPFVKEMVIDNNREYPLVTKSKTFSDHFTTYLDVAVSFTPYAEPRREIYNFRNLECQKKFKDITDKTHQLSEAFETDENFDIQCDTFLKILDQKFQSSFRKIRVNGKIKVSEENSLLTEKLKLNNDLKKNVGDKYDTEKKIEEIENRLSNLTAKKNRDKVFNNFKALDDNTGGGVWQIKNKVFPKHQNTPPMAKKDITGKLVTAREDIKQLYLDTFSFRLRERPIKPGYEEIQELTENLCKARLEITENLKTENWTMQDLEKVLSKLKKNKARDPSGLANEIFMKNSAGNDLKKALLMMMNKIKETKIIPKFATLKNITAIPKKGAKTNLENERGIVIGSVFNTILMNLIYEDKYEVIDENMSDGQAGARKDKATRNNNFVLNACMNEAVQKKDNLDVIILDVKQAFDSLYLADVCIDLYDSGVQDDHLNIIHKADSISQVAVNTPCGITDRRTVKDSVLQGECLGPLKCGNSIDKICKTAFEEKENVHFYRNSVPVPPLALIDDIIAMAKCGTQSAKLNGFLNGQVNTKKLQLGVKKCHKIHVGKNQSVCPDLLIDNWKLKPSTQLESGSKFAGTCTLPRSGSQNAETRTLPGSGLTTIWDLVDNLEDQAVKKPVTSEVYLGSEVSDDAKNTKNIQARIAKGTAAGNAILQILNEEIFGPYETEVFIRLRDSLMISTLLHNAETWFGVTKKEVEQLENLDLRFLRKKFELHSKIPKEMIYLELGIVPVSFLLMKKRLSFLQYILQQPEQSLIYQVLKAMIENPAKNDWIELVRKDLQDLDIKLSFEDIKNTTKEKFKVFVKEVIEEKAFEHLLALKEKHSKLKNLKYGKFKIQNYLKSDTKFSSSEINFALNIRANMLNVKGNFRTAYQNIKCRLCTVDNSIESHKNLIESQGHLLTCVRLNSNSLSTGMTIQYEELFSEDKDKILEITRRIKFLFNQFQELVNSPSEPVVVNSVSAALDNRAEAE